MQLVNLGAWSIQFPRGHFDTYLTGCISKSSGPMVEMASGALWGSLDLCRSAYWDQSLGPPRVSEHDFGLLYCPDILAGRLHLSSVTVFPVRFARMGAWAMYAVTGTMFPWAGTRLGAVGLRQVPGKTREIVFWTRVVRSEVEYHWDPGHRHWPSDPWSPPGTVSTWSGKTEL